MGRRVRLLSALAAGTLACVVGTSTAHATLTSLQYKCQATIAKEGAKFVKGALKARQKCADANLVALGSCTAADLTKLQDKLRSGLAKKCTFLSPSNTDLTPANLAAIGFPGPCFDTDPPSSNFSLLDLQNCIEDSHDDLTASMVGVEYDSTVTAGTLTGTPLTCQKAIASNSAKFVAALMKNVQKCRNDLLNCSTSQDLITTCKLTGLLAQDCATDPGPALASECVGGTNAGAACASASECPGGGSCDGVKFANQKTVDAIAKAKTKAHDAIVKKCSDADAVAIEACEPNQSTADAAATCELDVHQALTDNPNPVAPSDLLDYEYAQRGICGDDRKNQPSEECDGIDDSACPGQCGAALGLFPCLCETTPRTRVVEHANADLDNGWSGQSHDSGIVEGGGYVTDLWDCDGPGGPDTICNVGPSCSGAPHSPCSPSPNPPANLDTGDEICASLGQGTCRKTEGGATGPHCELDFQKRCKNAAQCTTIAGDRCVIVPHGPPLPISSGGVSVCVVNNFTEDVVGTTDVSPSGGGSVRLRQGSSTFLGPDQQQPCPVCGGFCSGTAGQVSPGTRNLCSSDADCNGGATCILAPVCSWGPRKDKACRPNTPAGGPTEFFGNPSVDCPMAGLLLGTIDILFNPATTGSTTLTANTDCGTTGFNNKVCAGGTNEHAPCQLCVGGGNAGAACAVAGDCPGGTCVENGSICTGGGTCNEQCFCGGGAQKPNGCEAACLGGPDDAQPCIDDSECGAPGFCHPGDCRLNVSDTDSSQEGQCTVGPADGRCSVHTFKPCTNDAGCGGGLCPFCDTSPPETCVFSLRQCFMSPTILRAGTPGSPDRTTGATFCITKTGSAAVDNVAGLPGPGAITTRETITDVGF